MSARARHRLKANGHLLLSIRIAPYLKVKKGPVARQPIIRRGLDQDRSKPLLFRLDRMFYLTAVMRCSAAFLNSLASDALPVRPSASLH
jgi:hypothetical protein